MTWWLGSAHWWHVRRPSQPATEVHGYTDRDLLGAPTIAQVWTQFREFVGTDLLVAHNGQEFDVPVLRRSLPRARRVRGPRLLRHAAARALAGRRQRQARPTSPRAFNVEIGTRPSRLRRRLHACWRGAAPQRAAEFASSRKIALVHLLDHSRPGACPGSGSEPDEEELLFRDITRPYTLGRYSDCLEVYAAEVAEGSRRSPVSKK